MNKPRLKILFIIPSMIGGGAERVLLQLLQQLDEETYQITLCVVFKKGIYLRQIPEHVKVITLFKDGYLLRVFNKLHVWFGINTLYKWLARRKLTDHYEIGVSFLDSVYTDLLFFLDARIDKKIAWVHASYLTNPAYKNVLKGAYLHRVRAQRYSRLDKIVFVSHDAKNEFESQVGTYKEAEVIYNFVDKELIIRKALVPLVYPFNKTVFNLIAVGNLLPVKDHTKLIKAVSRLKQDNIPFVLRILGEGHLYLELTNLIKSLDLTHQIILEGFVENPYPLMKNSDIFIMSSNSEALPSALIEAMILGMPSVVTNCSGCREVAAQGAYSLVTANNESALYEGIQQMLLNESMRQEYKSRALEGAKRFSSLHQIDKIKSCLVKDVILD